MSDSNKYVDMSAKEALKLAKDKFLLLPDIQREYVWSMDDIEKSPDKPTFILDSIKDLPKIL